MNIKSALKSFVHNLGVVAVGFIFALLGKGVDRVFGWNVLHSPWILATAVLLVTAGFLLRFWATYLFYQHHMNVVEIKPQGTLITTGPYRFTRNPLYLGGNVFIFLGASLALGSPGALILTALQLLLVDRMIRREERQLEKACGQEWLAYKRRVRRWI